MSVKKRLIFVLLYNDGFYCQSRNFNLQKVGKLQWLLDSYEFSRIAEYLDELVVIDTNPQPTSRNLFFDDIKKIISKVFIPISIGGGINDIKTAYKAFSSGADKIILNSLIRENHSEAIKIINTFGSQSVVASVDYKRINGIINIFNWKVKGILHNVSLKEQFEIIHNIGFGEILFNSVNNDGTGFGFDLKSLSEVSKYSEIPLIVIGGAGKPDHFEPVLKMEFVDAAATANLFNFMGDGIPNTRKQINNKSCILANFH